MVTVSAQIALHFSETCIPDSVLAQSLTATLGTLDYFSSFRARMLLAKSVSGNLLKARNASLEVAPPQDFETFGSSFILARAKQTAQPPSKRFPPTNKSNRKQTQELKTTQNNLAPSAHCILARAPSQATPAIAK